MPSPFSIFVLDSSGVRVGSGPLNDVTLLEDTRQLDRIGTVTFEIPATAPRVPLIGAGSQFDIYDEVDGYLGRFFFKSDSLSEATGLGKLRVTAYDALVELRREIVGFRRQYEFTPVDQVVHDLVTLVTSWTTNIDPAIGNTSVIYEGESVFSAVDELRDRWGQHYRLTYNPAITSTRILDFGAFGEDSDVRFTNLDGQIEAYFAGRAYIAIVKTIRRERDGDEIFNRIVPRGAGTGVAQVTIDDALLGDYPVLTAANKDGSTYAYIQDNDSVADYGVRVRVVTFPTIAPIANSDLAIQYAKEATKLAGEAYLRQHLNPRVEYSVTVVGLRKEIKVGDTVRLQYRGAGADGVYIDVDEDFYVMDMTRRRDAAGTRVADLNIASVNQRRTSDQDVMVDVVRDLKSLKLHIQPLTFWSENTYLDTLQSDTDVDNIKDAEFKLEVDNSVTDVIKVRIRFKSKPLYTLSRNSVPLNYPTSFYSGADPHQHFLAEGPLNESFGVTPGTLYPTDISLEINGVDVSNDLGGPWATGGLNKAIDVTLDITNYIRNATNGLRQDHQLVFSCGQRSGDVSTSNSSDQPITDGNASQGFIELNIRMLGFCQLIAPTE